MNRTLVSVVIPTYNGARYLRECLESVQRQTFKAIEIVIVDDNSTDDTIVIAQDHASRDQRIRVARNQRNVGLAENWNRSIQAAQGQWIKFVFQDDTIEPECVSTLLQYASQYNGFAACARRFEFSSAGVTPEASAFYEENQHRIESLFSGCERLAPESICRLVVSDPGFNFLGEPTCVLVSRDALMEAGPVDDGFVNAMDLELWSRIGIQRGVARTPRVMATFRVHDGSASAENWRCKSFERDWVDPLVRLWKLLYDPAYQRLRECVGNSGEFARARTRFKELRCEVLWRARKARDLEEGGRTRWENVLYSRRENRDGLVPGAVSFTTWRIGRWLLERARAWRA